MIQGFMLGVVVGMILETACEIYRDSMQNYKKFVLKVGNKRLVKRKEFEKYIEKSNEI